MNSTAFMDLGLTQDSSEHSGDERRVSLHSEVDGESSNKPRQRSSGRVYLCRYCNRKFHCSQALGGHQNGHRKERTQPKRATENSLYPHYPAWQLSVQRNLAVMDTQGIRTYSCSPEYYTTPPLVDYVRLVNVEHSKNSWAGFYQEDAGIPDLSVIEEDPPNDCSFSDPDLTLKL